MSALIGMKSAENIGIHAIRHDLICQFCQEDLDQNSWSKNFKEDGTCEKKFF
jgi:hypothetical protein